jgi:murein DD-endopeptidase MepM/ murein hydrolase activator NlpD
MQKGLLATAISMMSFLCACSLGFIVMYVVIVGLTIPQLPTWAQQSAEEWMLDIPQFSEHIEEDSYVEHAPAGNQQHENDGKSGDDDINSGGGGDTLPALIGPVPWSNYFGPDGNIQGFPLWGPITHPWGGAFDAPLIGCTFHDKNYKNHTGFDSPVSVGTPIHATMGGQVVWAGYTKGGWGRLVVVENGDYQIWMAHLSEIDVQVGELVEAGQVLGLSGGDHTQDEHAGNSSGAHLHYGVKNRIGPDTYVWVDPTSFFDLSQMTRWGCSN